MPEPIDYEKVVADLEAKRAMFNAWVDGAIQNMRQVLAAISGMPANSVGMTGVQATGSVGTLAAVTPDAFFGLGIGDAAVKYLKITKKQQSTREITDALVAASYPHTSQNFANTVNTALYRRSKDEADVIRIGRNWALAEWYPGRRRAASLRPSDFETDSSQAATDDSDENERD